MMVLMATIAGTVGVLATLIFNAWQAKQILKQLRLQNSMAGLDGTHQPMELLHGVLRLFYEDPSLRPYFYEGKPLPHSSDRRSQVLAVGEMLGDVLEVGLFNSKEIKATAAYDDWLDYATFLMQQSPALAHLVRFHPGWYPVLVPLLRPDNTEDSPGNAPPTTALVPRRSINGG